MTAIRSLARVSLAAGLLLSASLPSHAFSQIGRQDGSAPDQDGVISTPLPPLSLPPIPPAGEAQNETRPAEAAPAAPTQETAPPATTPTAPAAPAAPAETPAAPQTPAPPDAAEPAPDTTGDREEGTDPAASQAATPTAPAGPPADVFYGDADLPAPVRTLRAKLLEIAKTGEIDKLREFIEPGEDGTVLSFGGVEGDPIDYLKSISGDGEGVEVMAILLEVLQSGHTRNEPGTDNEIFVWPYFAGVAIDKLTKQQKVELFELVTAGDYQEMLGFGAYNFYRVGISPDGKLQFFVAGD
ncbi:hypothetical protein [Aureimonas psammosilenae]|uniref:hypothetical protein n=1 Tax=Aureimonas psammosilenae TaxID=2495496 RepID=UPI001261093D|nr:hypothetical protein [Aureimonas psammosilenae]